MILRIANMTVVLVMVASMAAAHHGKDYMEIEGYTTPERSEYMVFSLFEYHVPGSGESHFWKLEPGGLYGITDKIALEAHAHLINADGANMAYESTALEARIRLAEEGTWALDPAASLEYEFSASGEPDVLTARLILGRNFRGWNITLNYWGEQGLGGGVDLISNYGIGANHRLFVFEKASLELIGAVGEETEHYLLPSVYLPIGKTVAIKAGAAFGLTSSSENVSVRSAVHLQF